MKFLRDLTIVIPLHLPLGYPSDYVDQTSRILNRSNQIILFDFRSPTMWQNFFSKDNFKQYLISIKNIFYIKHGEIYFKPISILPFRRFEVIFKLNRWLGILQLNLLLKILGKKVLIWGFDPIIESVIGKLNEKICIYDCVDFLGQDPQTKSSYQSEKKIFKAVDIVAFNSYDLAKIKITENYFLKNKSVVTVCGCSYELFQKKIKTVPTDIKKIKEKKIILAGVFDYRLDVNLVRYLVLKNPHIAFVLIGPILNDVSEEFFSILKAKNIFYLGKKQKKVLPDYYQNCQVGIIPYNTALKFVKYSNPMKAYEYLASGIPVVATDIVSLKKYPNNIVFTSDNYKIFDERLKKLLTNWKSSLARKAKDIAKDNSWERKIEIIGNFIFDFAAGKSIDI